jgi:hypothetical protein
MIRFLTLFALFTAAGTWLQMVKFRGEPPTILAEPLTTSAQDPATPATKTAERPVAPTSAGPLSTTPIPNIRAGQARQNHDFAKLDSNPVPAPALAGADGGTLPRVQTSEVPNAGAEIDPASEEETRSPEVARLPGFIIDLPSR